MLIFQEYQALMRKPENPDIEVDTTGKSIEETVEYIFSRLKKYL